MAAKKRKYHKKRAKSQRNAGTRRHTKRTYAVRHHRRRNPGLGRATEYIKLGASVVGGAVGSKYATQLVLGAKNTGWMGYLGNLVATGLLAWGANMAFRDKIVAQGVVGGGIAQVIVRVIGDQTPYGQYLSGVPGVGDYQASAFLTPQRMTNALHSAEVERPGWSAPPANPIVTHSATAAAGMGWSGPDWN